MPYFHVVYTLPAEIADIAYQNKAVIYDLLFKTSAETTLTIAVDPKHLGARIGFMSVQRLHPELSEIFRILDACGLRSCISTNCAVLPKLEDDVPLRRS